MERNSSSNHQTALSLIIVALAALFGGALLAPVVYECLARVYPTHGYPYSRVFHRVAMVVAFLCLVLMRKRLGLAALVRELFHGGWREPVRLLVLGAAIALGTSLLVLPLVVTGSPLTWQQRSWGGIVEWYLRVIPGALIVSILEESFFRFILFGQLRHVVGVIPALALSSLLYAVVHFMTPISGWVYPGYGVFVGFSYLSEVMERMSSPAIERGILGLAVVGAVLAGLFHRYGRLWLCIGLHAGWVVAIKTSFYFTAVAPGFQFPSGVGRRYFLVAEPITWCAVVLAGAIAWVTLRARRA